MRRTLFSRGNLWKRMGIAGMAIFLIVILIAAAKDIKFRSRFGEFSEVSEEQKEMALSLIEESSLEEYNVTVADIIMEIDKGGKRRHVMKVILEKEGSMKSYLIDTDEWKVIFSLEMKYGGWMKDGKKRFIHHRRGNRWVHKKIL